jgi:hypothetical protein
MQVNRIQVAIDCADPASLARFWAEALGYVVQPPPDGFDTWEAALASWGVPESEWNSASAIVDPDGGGPRIYFQRVPESKAGKKNRLHLDLGYSDGPSSSVAERRPVERAAVERLVALGATEVGEVEEMGGVWVVMLDPEGNEFCVC